MVQIRRNHQQNDKQKSIIVRLLLIVVLFSVIITLFYRYYTDGIHKYEQVHTKWSDELVNRTYLPSCVMKGEIHIKGNFSWCKDTVSGELTWLASEWNLSPSGNIKDSVIFSGIKDILTTQISDSKRLMIYLDNIMPEMLQYINSGIFTEKLLLLFGPITNQTRSVRSEKQMMFFVAFDPELNNLFAYKKDLSSNDEEVWSETSIDNIESIFGIDFFYHYLSPKVEKVIESQL